MNYNETFITRPIRYDEVFELPIKGTGDSYFVSMIEYDLQLQDLGEPRTFINKLPFVHVTEIGSHIAAISTEGQDLNLGVTLTQPLTVDLIVNLEITADSPIIPTKTLLVDTSYPDTSESSSHTLSMQSGALLTDFATTTVDVIIPAGELTGTSTLSTVDDNILTQTLRTASVKILSTSEADVRIAEDINNAIVILKDSTPYPKWEGTVEMHVRAHELSHKEPLYSSETSAVQAFTFGWLTNDLGELSEDSILQSIQVDDIPVYSLFFQPPNVADVADLTADANDLTTMLPFYRAIVQVGRRA